MKKNAFIPVLAIITTLFFTLSSCGEKDKDNETPNQSPSCIINAPASGQEIVTGTLVTIAVDADDADGTIAEVRFFVDEIGKGTAVAFPYNYSWNTAGETAGNHTIKATAIDNAGARTSDEVVIMLMEAVDAPLAEFIATPLSGIAPLLVSFIDQSENDPVSWQWDFGDGNYSTEQNPLHTYDATGTFTVSLTVENSQGADTEAKSDYIVVVFGVGTGEPCPGIPMVSYGGQLYNTVLINDQCWLKENLNIGSMISSTQNQSNNGGIEKYCYGNLIENCDIYGGLYQWDEMMQYITTEGTQGICPPGWHIPTDGEWMALTDHLGGVLTAGGKMKETGTAHWNSPNTGATNSSNFTAFPGGICENGIFNNMGRWGLFWSSTEYNTSEAYRLLLYYNFPDADRYRKVKDHALSVRCLKD